VLDIMSRVFSAGPAPVKKEKKQKQAEEAEADTLSEPPANGASPAPPMPAPGAARCTNPFGARVRFVVAHQRATTPNAHSGVMAQAACLATPCLRVSIHHA
jgi:hypothetical protein